MNGNAVGVWRASGTGRRSRADRRASRGGSGSPGGVGSGRPGGAGGGGWGGAAGTRPGTSGTRTSAATPAWGARRAGTERAESGGGSARG